KEAKGSLANVRVAVIVAEENGTATNCSIANAGQCGKSICNNKPPDGDNNACTIGRAGDCAGPSSMYPQGQYCKAMQGSQGQCENMQLEYFNMDNCLWCSFFNAPDCCSAIGGYRYIDFAKEVEKGIH